MLARHTPTRMKGSGVYHSIKSWVSKLHPPLPLSPKESQRLLTALTSSFRQQLDHSHPQRVSGDHAKSENGKASPLKNPAKELHTSSIHLADRHLASVLTNPLLSNTAGRPSPILDYTSAERELDRNPFRDPISLLERYQKTGAATYEIAILCLRKFRSQLEALPKEERRRLIQQREAGRRTFAWLLESKNDDTAAFVDDRRLMKDLVYMLLEEGLDAFLWSWLRLDLTLGPTQPPDHVVRKWELKQSKLKYKLEMYRQRWKRHLAYLMVNSKLAPRHHDSVEAAIDVVLQFHDEAIQPESLSMMIWPIKTLLNKNAWLTQTTDAKKFDRMAEIWRTSGRTAGDEWEAAALMLFHPTSRSAMPVVKALRRLLLSDSRDLATRTLSFRNSFLSSATHEKGTPPYQVGMARFVNICQALALLRRDGSVADYEWLREVANDVWPDLSRYVDQNGEDFLRGSGLYERDRRGEVGVAQEDKTRTNSQSNPISFPSFT